MHLGSDNIIKLKFTTNFDRCAILNLLNCLTENIKPWWAYSYLEISMQTVTETADILLSIYHWLHIQIIYQLFASVSVV